MFSVPVTRKNREVLSVDGAKGFVIEHNGNEYRVRFSIHYSYKGDYSINYSIPRINENRNRVDYLMPRALSVNGSHLSFKKQAEAMNAAKHLGLDIYGVYMAL